MPKKGFKAITVKEQLYKKVSELAEKQKKSIAKVVTEIIMAYIESLKDQQRSNYDG